MVTINAGGAAAAAAAAARKRREEEEEMTSYTASELEGDWEFKILRSATGSFKRLEVLRQALAEESAAGWVLVEKFDNGRVRLKRPASAKQNDHASGGDPYRTAYGTTEGELAAMIIGAAIAGVVLMMIIVAALAR